VAASFAESPAWDGTLLKKKFVIEKNIVSLLFKNVVYATDL